ncbi:hypothetical protein C823_001398 [Eubacterium plexicaudatum ASF492]|uniref:ATP-grasp domain-containing protein n=1 Tax=Eubacterium plexicaudatum ASF492 TaxID=1235802 RepID=N2BDJ5_9FIRM|nr:hypothetical protein C823_001398 [Eubacterium plexicaudatum ASF492]
MRQAALLGNIHTKRTDYLKQAAAQAGLPVLFVDWKEFETWKKQLAQGEWLIKIDPPLWDSCQLAQLEQLTKAYREQLHGLSQAARNNHLEFLNAPDQIAQLLDKRICKQKLKQAGLAVTEEPDDGRYRIDTPQQLFRIMRTSGMHQVFIKPVSGSGAAGVTALRWQPHTGRMALYTCAFVHEEYGLINTKRLRHFSVPGEITAYLEQLLKLDCVVERWYAKAQAENFSYDLRAVVLDGEVQFLLGRLSKGPITNLHLNNRPIEAEKLPIERKTLEEIAFLCKRAVNCFPGIRIAGIDILLEKETMRPRIIEMNAQGDLIYQDIFHENSIYRRQVEMMLKWIRTCAD